MHYVTMMMYCGVINKMTKVIILGQEYKKPTQKPIEFIKLLTHSFATSPNRCNPCDWKNIELICRNYGYENKFDLMFGYDDKREYGFLYLGHFNDGVVE